MRKLMIGAAVLAILVVGAVGWLFYANGSPQGRFPLDLAAIRAAAAQAGPGPTRIEVETVSHQAVPEIAMVAGGRWGKIDMIRTSYRLVWPDGVSGIIDTTYDRATAKDADRFDEAALARVRRGMAGARWIVVTHEHSDHLGGLKTDPAWRTTLPHALLTPEQLASPVGTLPPWPAGARAVIRPFAYDRIKAIAPGVVLIKAPGHTPGSQMIYVRRADGREYIFMGDVASTLANVTTGHIRSHLVTDWMTHDDRPAVLRQVTALKIAQVASPGLVLVPGHDGAAIAALARNGDLATGFRF